MPTYDYECLSCKDSFELFQSMTEEPISRCPKCGGKVKRLIGTGAGPIFKGSGFYQTDYKNSSNNSNKKNTSTSPPADKSTAKPAASSGSTSK